MVFFCASFEKSNKTEILTDLYTLFDSLDTVK